MFNLNQLDASAECRRFFTIGSLSLACSSTSMDECVCTRIVSCCLVIRCLNAEWPDWLLTMVIGMTQFGSCPFAGDACALRLVSQIKSLVFRQ